jgi:hypothetical protein
VNASITTGIAGVTIASGREQALEERAVVLQDLAQVFRRHVVSPLPFRLEPAPLFGEGAGKALHHFSDEAVGLADSSLRLISSGLRLDCSPRHSLVGFAFRLGLRRVHSH